MTTSQPALRESPKIYTGTDLFKLLIALFIVFTHTYCSDWGTVGLWIRNNLSLSGVPFFFIVSGFFFEKGLKKSEDAGSYLKKYLIRIGGMYLFWFVITLPVAWYSWILTKPSENTLFRVFRVFRSFFFAGGMGVYWYLLSLLCVCPILYLLYRRPRMKAVIWPLAAVLFAVGALYYMGKLDGSLVYTGIHVVFGSERNFLTAGLFYMCIGTAFAENEVRLRIPFPAALLLLLAALAVGTFTVKPFGNALIAVFLVIFALNLNPRIPEKYSHGMRKLSTGIYLIHFPFILLFDFYLKRGTLIDYPLTLAFSVAVFLFSSLLLPKKIKKIIYG